MPKDISSLTERVDLVLILLQKDSNINGIHLFIH